jgi:ribokinase
LNFTVVFLFSNPFEHLMKQIDVVVLGSVNMDFIYRVKQLPALGETVTALSYLRAAGGKGANQAVAAARQGATVGMIGCIGLDDIGKTLVHGLTQDNINTEHVHAIDQAPTGMASIYVDDKAENNIVIVAGANALLSSRHAQDAKAMIQSARCLVCQFETPLATFIEAAQIAKQNGVTVILNPSPVRDFDLKLLSLVDVLVVNEIEAKQLSRGSDTSTAAIAFLALGPTHIIVSLGAKGVLHITKDSSMHLAAFNVTAKDTTGAGDTFAGCLAAALAKGLEMKIAIRHAQAAAAICVTRDGAQPSIPYQAEVDALLQQQNHGNGH